MVTIIFISCLKMRLVKSEMADAREHISPVNFFFCLVLSLFAIDMFCFLLKIHPAGCRLFAGPSCEYSSFGKAKSRVI